MFIWFSRKTFAHPFTEARLLRYLLSCSSSWKGRLCFFFLNCFFFFFFLNFVGCVDCVALLSVFFLVKFKYRHDPRFSLGKFRFDNNIRLCSRFLISFLYLFFKKELIRLKCCSMLKKKRICALKTKGPRSFFIGHRFIGATNEGPVPLFVNSLIYLFIWVFPSVEWWRTTRLER